MVLRDVTENTPGPVIINLVSIVAFGAESKACCIAVIASCWASVLSPEAWVCNSNKAREPSWETQVLSTI